MNQFAFVDKLSQESVIARLEQYKQGRPLTPIVVEFDCTTQCNLACEHCIGKHILGSQYFDGQELSDYADALHRMGTKAIILSGGGEPLMNPYFDGFIAKLKAYGLQIGLITNGTLLHEHTDTLRDISWVRLSMDAATDEMFFRMKGVHAFDAVLQNIGSFAKAKGRCSLGYSFLIVCNEKLSNIREIAAAARIAKELGCDYFEIKLQFEDVEYNHPDIPLAKEEMDEIARQIEAAQALASPGFAVLTNLNVKRLFSPAEYPDQTRMEQCYICHLRSVITPQGLYTCSYHRGHRPMKYGESRGADFGEVWHDRARLDMVRRMDPLKCCVNCARGPANMRIIEMLGSDGPWPAEEDYDLFI